LGCEMPRWREELLAARAVCDSAVGAARSGVGVTTTPPIASLRSLHLRLSPYPLQLLERRLQTKVFKSHLAKSIHHARVLIKQRHIRVGKQVVNVPSFLVRVDSEKHIDFASNSPYSDAGRKGRVARKNAAAKAGGGEDE